MHILHVLDHSAPLHSGYTFRTLAILRGQRGLGWRTSQVTGAKQNSGELREEDVEGIHFYRTPRVDSMVARLPVVRHWAVIDGLARRLDEIIVHTKPDVLHAHSPALNGLAALRAGRRHGIPVVYECRAFWEDAAVDHGTSLAWGPRYRLTRALETHVFQRADAVTTICEGLKREIIDRGIDAGKVTVIPNAVDIRQFRGARSPNLALARKHNLDGRIVLGFIGSFYAYEGLSLLIDAFANIRAQAPEVCILLVGGGPQEQHLREQTCRLGLESAVHFTGRVPHDTVADYYDLVHFFVYPRLSMRLTDLVTPLKPLEAMAQERLVVASDVGGHRELIRDGETGSLFPAGDSDALAAKVMNLLRYPEHWDDMRRAGRRYVETERNWPAVVKRYEWVYAPLLRSAT